MLRHTAMGALSDLSITVLFISWNANWFILILIYWLIFQSIYFPYLKSNIRNFGSERKTVLSLSLQKDSLRKPSWKETQNIYFPPKAAIKWFVYCGKLCQNQTFFDGGNGGVTLHRTGHWVRNIFLFATHERMPVAHSSLFGGSYFIYLEQYSLKLHLFERKQPKKIVPR